MHTEYIPSMLILNGVSGSGKSTFAKAWVAEDPDARIRVNYDELRRQMFGENWVFNRPDEDRMQAHARDIVERAGRAGLSVVIDNTNLSRHVRDRWAALGKDLGLRVEEEDVLAPISICVQRDAARDPHESVGAAVIYDQALRYGFLEWHVDDRIVICDIDGTLADCSSRLRYIKPATENDPTFKKDWKKFHAEVSGDAPITELIDLVNSLSVTKSIVLLTGRPMVAGKDTVKWLEQHDVCYDYLFMRRNGDHRADWEMKQEVLEYLPKEQIHLVLEDRDGPTKMFRSHGLRVLQVADGSY